MREAIGAGWIMTIVITFITLFSGYLAFSINYSKAFSVKDGIIDRIEKNRGVNENTIKDIANFLNEVGYNSKGKCENFVGGNKNFIGVTGGSVGKKNPTGSYNYCIQKVSGTSTNGQLNTAYYQVIVFFTLDLPIVNSITNFYVSGESDAIVYPVEGNGYYK